jgi:acyl carrier protein
VEDAVRKPIRPQTIPFNREQATPLAAYLRLEQSENAEPRPATEAVSVPGDIRASIRLLFRSLTGIEEIDPELELVEQGLDSMSATELVNQLEEQFSIDIGPDIFFDHPLFDQFATEIEKRVEGKEDQPYITMLTRDAIDQLVVELFFQLTSINEIDPNIELTEQGLDSMSGTELISQLESKLQLDIGPDFIFEFPLRDQLVDELYARSGAGLN